MKLYSKFYNTNPKNGYIKINRSPMKNTSMIGVTFSSKPSNKTLHIPNHRNIGQEYRINRNLVQSIQQIYRSSSVQNQEANNHSLFQNLIQKDDMFGKSYAKIYQIKESFHNKNIDKELNDILVMLKEQKQKINERIKDLKRSNEYFKRICEGKGYEWKSIATNTEQSLQDKLEKCSNKDIQVEESQFQPQIEKQKSEQEIKKVGEVYKKLRIMLEDMKIYPEDILPCNPEEEQEKSKDNQSKSENAKEFKTLTDSEIIKIQRFFIRKLTTKLQK